MEYAVFRWKKKFGTLCPMTACWTVIGVELPPSTLHNSQPALSTSNLIRDNLQLDDGIGSCRDHRGIDRVEELNGIVNALVQVRKCRLVVLPGL